MSVSRRPYAEVIGDPITHSKSPMIHGFWLKALGIDTEYRPLRIQRGDLAGYFAARRSDPDWRGCNITMPHKIAALDHVDDLAEEARLVGAINGVVPDSGSRLTGFNTDIHGVADLLRRLGRTPRPYPDHVATYVQIIGAGGAARAAAAGAIAAGYGDFDVFNRSVEKAHDLAGMVGAPFGEAHALDQIGPIRNPGDTLEDQRYSHVVINATSMGMNDENPVPIDLGDYYPDTIVFDMVYAPPETKMLRAAKARGLRTIDGLDMLIAQAAASFTRFFSCEPPREHDAELRALLEAS